MPNYKGVAAIEPTDELACSAAAFRMVGLELFIAVGPHTIKELLRNEERLSRKKYWQQFTGMRQTKITISGYILDLKA